MTYYNNTRSPASGLAIEISAAVHHMVQAFNDYMDYRATIRALSQLDDASLADFGLSRSGIRAAAREAVYGA